MAGILSPIACVERVIECDNARDAAGYRAIIHDDYRAWVHGQPSSMGAEAEVESLTRWWSATRDVHLQCLSIWESEGVVTLRYTLEGTNDGEFFGRPATGRSFKVENCTLLEVVGGKVSRAWRYSDTLGLMTQLGLLADSSR